MRFLDQPIDFSPVAGQTMAAYAASVSAAQLLDFSVAVHRAGRRLVSLWGSDERDRAADAGSGFALHVAFDLAEGLACLSLPLPADNPAFPDLASLFYSANRLQRAACDLLGLRIEDGEDTRPWLRHANWPACKTALADRRFFAVTTHGARRYDQVDFQSDDVFVFGCETRGLPASVMMEFPENHRLRLPMLRGQRSLNLSNAVAVMVFEAWRQHGFPQGV